MNDHAAKDQGRLLQRVRPSRDDLVDGVFALVLGSLGVVGLDASFGGNEAYVVGVPAVAAGVLIGYLVYKARVPLLVGAVLAVAGLLLFAGPVALRSDALAGILPSIEVADNLVDGSINGWKRLLTSVPPAAGEAGNLVAIPYVAGYLGGLLGIVFAMAFRRPVCVLPPLAVLVTSILFGVDEPASLLLQGAVFGALTVAWICIRVNRYGPVVERRSWRARAVGGLAMLGISAVAAFAVGPLLPGAGANERYVFRDQVDPPFNPGKYPSPLARFRAFDGIEPIADTLFTVEGVPAGTRVRFAVMDVYDGFVWRASDSDEPEGGTYDRVGDTIPGAQPGDSYTARFTMRALATNDSVWIPTVGSPTSIRFTGERADELREEFRFNRLTESAASPLPLEAGDTWEVDFTLPDQPEDLSDLPTLSGVSGTEPTGATEEVLTKLREQILGEASSPFERAEAIRSYLLEHGWYNQGTEERPIRPGHGVSRLVDFITSDHPEGNGEQFAAAVAFLAEAAGVPARVVLEFEAAGEGVVEVTAEDIRAVVEIGLDGAGWVPLEEVTPTTPPLEDPAPPPPLAGDVVQPPPPTTAPPPRVVLEEPERDDDSAERSEEASDGSGSGFLSALLAVAKVASIPLVLIGGPAALIIGAKARRAARRRSRGTPAERVSNGWREVTDLARDFGEPVPPKATRREIGRFLAVPEAAVLAAEIDEEVFGYADPDDEVAEGAWAHVDAVKQAMKSGRTRVERIRASVSLTSLRRAGG